jgi:hypothetical protein
LLDFVKQVELVHFFVVCPFLHQVGVDLAKTLFDPKFFYKTVKSEIVEFGMGPGKIHTVEGLHWEVVQDCRGLELVSMMSRCSEVPRTVVQLT